MTMSLDQMCNFIFLTKVSTWLPPTIHLRAVKFYEPTWCIHSTWYLNLAQQICGRACVNAFILFWLLPDNWLKNTRFYADCCIRYVTIATRVNISQNFITVTDARMRYLNCANSDIYVLQGDNTYFK